MQVDTYSPWTHRHHRARIAGIVVTNETQIKRALGGCIRELRHQRGLSQEALALACDLDRTYIGGVERGERNISLINIYRIAAALRVSPGSLLPNVLSERGKK